jgi:hypothetical protein
VIRSRPILLSLAVVVLVPRAGGAQDANYWTLQYGPVAQLLGGQVVASTRDLSATFYNPGGLGLSEKPSFLLSTYAVGVQSVSVNPVDTGELRPLSSRTLGPAPSLIAVALPRGWLGQQTRLAFSFLVRQAFDIRLQARSVGDLAGLRYGAEELLDQSMIESWGGLTFARRMGDSWGLGITWYGIYRGQRTRRESSLQTSNASLAGVNALTVSDFNYGHMRTLAKVGVAWQSERWRAGLAVATPSLGVWGRGDAGYTDSFDGIDVNGDGQPDSVLSNGYVKDAPADFHSSWTVAGGLAWQGEHQRLDVTAEWFAADGPFTVIDVTGPDVEGDFSQGYVQEFKSVLNAGVGYERRLSSGVKLFGAFHTDFSAVPEDSSLNLATSTWNLYHLTAGTEFSVAGSRFTLGASYAMGSNEVTVGGKLPPDVPLLGVTEHPTVHYSRLTLIVGFVFGSEN